MTEYNNTANNGLSCSYTTLNRYNNRSSQDINKNPPVPATTVSGKYIVPTYSSPGYNTLMHNSAPSCSGYFNIEGAYGSDSKSCSTKYITKECQ